MEDSEVLDIIDDDFADHACDGRIRGLIEIVTCEEMDMKSAYCENLG